MAWSYRKRIKIIPRVHLNFSKNGISTSIGVRGANITFSPSGTYLNTGIPGTGIYNRSKISFEKNNPTPTSIVPFLNDQPNNIFSAEIHTLTSEGMEGVKEAIFLAQKQRNDLQKDLAQIKSSLSNSKVKLGLSYIFLYGLLFNSISKKIIADIQAKRDAILEIERQLESCYVNVAVDLNSNDEWQYEQLVESFKKMCKSAKIWDVTASIFQDTKITRTSTSKLVVKKEVRFGIKEVPDIKSQLEPLWLNNINGADLFIFPSFVVMYSSASQFAVIEIEKIDLQHDSVRFVETETIPSDSKIIDKTWARINENGTPDRRFRNNYQIPVVQYGELIFRSKTGINEAYYVSNYEYSRDFAKAFHDYQEAIKSSKSYDDKNLINPVTEPLEPSPKTEETKVKLTDDSENVPDILQTEASIVTEFGKECGKITKISGAVDHSDIKLYLSLEDWKRFPIHLIPSLSIALKVDVKSNFLIVTSSNKDISPLKKGDTLTIYLDDNSIIEKKLLVGRTISGKIVTNIIILRDLELIQLSQALVNSLVMKSEIQMPYEFTNVSNNQYSNTLQGKELFKIISERIISVKKLLINKSTDNEHDSMQGAKLLT